MSPLSPALQADSLPTESVKGQEIIVREPEWDLRRGPRRETEEQRVFASTGERPTGVSGLLGRRESNSHLPGCNNTNTSNTSLLSTKHQTKAWGCSHEQETVLSQQGWRPSKLAFRTD